MPLDHRRIDTAIDRLASAQQAAGLPAMGPAPRTARAELAAISADIAPLRLPADLERFWGRVDPWSVAVASFPRFESSPRTALQGWHTITEDGLGPRALFPLCYESHAHVSVELDTGDNDGGGSLFDWYFDGDPFVRTHVDLAAFLDLLSTFLETDDFSTDADRTFANIDEYQWDGARTVRLSSTGAHPVHGTVTRIDQSIEHWPAHWQRAQGVADHALVARGTTASIAELLAEAARGNEARGTIRARVVRLAGTTGQTRMTVADDSGELDLWCSHHVPYHPPIRTVAEFDVVLRAGLHPPADVDGLHGDTSRAALRGDLDAAGDLAKRMFDRLFGSGGADAPAEAVAVRPVD